MNIIFTVEGDGNNIIDTVVLVKNNQVDFVIPALTRTHSNSSRKIEKHGQIVLDGNEIDIFKYELEFAKSCTDSKELLCLIKDLISAADYAQMNAKPIFYIINKN